MTTLTSENSYIRSDYPYNFSLVKIYLKTSLTVRFVIKHDIYMKWWQINVWKCRQLLSEYFFVKLLYIVKTRKRESLGKFKLVFNRFHKFHIFTSLLRNYSGSSL